MSRLIARSAGLFAVVALILALPAIGEGQGGVSKDATPEEREVIARDFLRRNHAELLALLDTLKPMNPEAYEKAIGEIFQTSRTLDALQAREPARHAVALEVWKTKSRVERLVAQDAKARTKPSSAALREAIAAQLDAEIAQKQYDRDVAEARLKKLDEQLGKLQADRDATIEARLKRVMKGRPAVKSGKAEKSSKDQDKDAPKRSETP